MSVDHRGILVAKSVGATTISVRAKGFQDDLVIGVAAPKHSVVVTPDTLTLRVGDSASLRAEASDSLGRPLDLQSLGQLYFRTLMYPSAAAAEGRVGGAMVFGRSRGKAEVNWTILGRCGIIAATVR
ncbi:MAG: hypothetical protein IT353_06635 [Gemmatimonadaceae bacterium]|nr:hypothetical protein [Gemmatimonadaceae bacterium]